VLPAALPCWLVLMFWHLGGSLIVCMHVLAPREILVCTSNAACTSQTVHADSTASQTIHTIMMYLCKLRACLTAMQF
jgi:hypothetical protein